ncbi:fucose isomerase [Verrucomicrobia bacterium S94]|nr:fucose isomerase [Verrucomicrobia bacterium S94]
MNPKNTPDFLQLPENGIAHHAIRELIPPFTKPRKTRLIVLGCGVRAHFPWDEACRRYNEATARIEAAVDTRLFEIVRAEAPYEDADLMTAFLNCQLHEGIDGLILFHASYTTGELGAILGRWLTINHVPLLSWSFPDDRGERLSANSMCCQNFLLGIFNTLGVKYAWFQQAVEADIHPMIPRFARSVRAVSRFKTGKLLTLGAARVPGFYDCELDELNVMKRYGIRVDRVGIDAVFDRAQKFSDAALKTVRDALIRSPECASNTVPDEQIFQTLRLALGTLDLASENNYIGCAVKSWPEMFDVYGCASDGAVSLMNDFGLCTTEEGDMNGLMSSMALFLISEGRAIPTMMDISIADTENNRLGIWHCGSSATRLLRKGTRFDIRQHSILENADPETAVGMMLEFLLELGEVTMVRYQSPDSSRMYGWEGDLRECEAAFRGSYGELEPKAPLTVDTIMGTIFDRGLDHHWSLGYGSWMEDLRMMNHWLGVEEIPHSNPGGMCGFSSC